ncbi:MAG: acyl carrier protein [Ignavibacteriae bacterium]|nr:acyl carrier protein [Ignavibacteriota bacterium]
MEIKIEEIINIFKTVFKKVILIDLETKIEDIPEWDSLGHLNLILEIEDRFDVSFTIDEIENCKSVKDIIVFLNNK